MLAKFILVAALARGGALPAMAADRAPAAILARADCHRGLPKFSASFSKYFLRVTENYLGTNRAAQKRALVGGPSRNLEEFELFATPGLPAGYPARDSRLKCWYQIYDYLSVLQRGNIGEAEAHLADWRNCVGAVYGGNFPTVAVELLECAGQARAASLPRVLPSAVKKAESLATP